MAYRIRGLERERFEHLFGLPDEALAAEGALRVIADSPAGYPCRVTLEEAAPGEELVLLNYVSHDVPGPFRTAYGIYVRTAAEAPASYRDEAPALLDTRALGLRGFDSDGLLRGALLAMPGEADERIRALFARPEIASIHAHNAAHGCFLAAIDRD